MSKRFDSRLLTGPADHVWPTAFADFPQPARSGLLPLSLLLPLPLLPLLPLLLLLMLLLLLLLLLLQPWILLPPLLLLLFLRLLPTSRANNAVAHFFVDPEAHFRRITLR